MTVRLSQKYGVEKGRAVQPEHFMKFDEEFFSCLYMSANRLGKGKG